MTTTETTEITEDKLFAFEGWYRKSYETDSDGHRRLDLDGDHISVNVLISGYVLAANETAVIGELKSYYGERFVGCHKIGSTDGYTPKFVANTKRKFSRKGIRVGR